MLSRRSFLSRSGLAAASAASAGALGAPHIARSADALLTQPGQKPKRIIHLVSDGMSLGTLTCSDQFALLSRNRGLAWMQLFRDPAARHALMNTRSLNSLVTDSAAASSAWGSGSHVTNGAINALPDGRLLTPLYPLFAQAGWARGLVTTAEITHATPAGFACATKSRSSSDIIASQYFEGKIDVLLGGGRPYFDPAKRRDKRDLRADFAAAGYSVVEDLAGLEKAPLDTRLLGTFAEGHLPYSIDQMASPKLRATTPTIAQMTTAALNRLQRSDNFILQIEGARIDHAAHNSDAAAAIRDQLALDEALEVCLAFQRRHPDTLLVVTTDHGNSNLGLNGMGPSYQQSSQRFAALGQIKASYPEILLQLEKVGAKIKAPVAPSDPEDTFKEGAPLPEPAAAKPEPAAAAAPPLKLTAAVELTTALELAPKAIIDIIADTTGYKMSARRAALFSTVLAGTYQALYDQMNSPISQLGQLMANRLGIGWTGNTHTSDYVPLIAVGPGAERFTGFLENTDVFTHYTALAGIDFKNPSVPLLADDAQAHDVEGIAAYSRADRAEPV